MYKESDGATAQHLPAFRKMDNHLFGTVNWQSEFDSCRRVASNEVTQAQIPFTAVKLIRKEQGTNPQTLHHMTSHPPQLLFQHHVLFTLLSHQQHTYISHSR